MVDSRTLDHILKETIETISRSHSEIYEIAENTRLEVKEVSIELAEVKAELQALIEEVDRLEQAEKKARLRLAEVSQDFHRYTEQDIKKAYEEAYNLQVELIRLREKEKLLSFRRNHLEMSLRRLQLTVEKAEKLAHQVGVVLKFLSGELQDLTSKIGELEQTYHLALSIIRAQEEERRRVAREIHDGPAQSLANIVMRAEYCLKLLEKCPGKVREELQALQNIVLTSLQDIRKIIFDLRPMVLDDLGLIPALKRYFSAYAEQYGLEVEFLCFGQQRRLDSAVEIALFRIVQEAVNNIKKHAKVKNAVVKMEMLPDKVTVVIRDEGQGFDLEAIQNRKEGGGFGLLGMKERVQLLKGQLKIITAPGKGTTVSVTIPLQSEESQ